MAGTPEWKKALRESNAIGWIGFFFLVVAIGVGSLIFGTGPERKADVKTTAAQTASGPNYLK